MSDTPTAHPLSWPVGWPRTRWPKVAQFGRNLTIGQATDKLQEELDRLGATEPVLSSNLALRLDGLPRSGQGQPADTGVAVYFQLHGRPHVLACDRWERVQWNIRAISKHVEALRGMDRWGVGSVEQAFTGYQALPEAGAEPAARHWTKVLGLDQGADADEVRSRYRQLSKERHPDAGGSEQQFKELERAKREALEECQ